MKARLNHGVVPPQFKRPRKLSTDVSIEEEASEQVEMITKRKLTDFESSVHTSILPFKCSPHSGEQVIQDLKESPGSSKWSNRGQKSNIKQMHAQRESKDRGRILRRTSNGGGSDYSEEGNVADFSLVHVDRDHFVKEKPNFNYLVIKEHDVGKDFLKEMYGMDEVIVKEEKEVDDSLMDKDEFHVKLEDESLDDIVKEEVDIDEKLKEEPVGMTTEDFNGKGITEWYIEGYTIKQEAEEGL